MRFINIWNGLLVDKMGQKKIKFVTKKLIGPKIFHERIVPLKFKIK